MVYPPFLQNGDKVAIISPSGRVDADYVYKASEVLRSWGLVPVIGKNALSRYGRFAASDADRWNDLEHALLDNEIKAILCSRGGYGAVRLLEKLSREIIIRHPKWLIGYSDITLLHAAYNEAGVISLHAPMCRHLSENPTDQSSHYLRSILFGEFPEYIVNTSPLNRCGTDEGQLVGGNLSVMSGLRATKFDSIKPGNILFIEDIGERHYHIERMLYNLKLSGVLATLSGLIVGQFTDCDDDPQMGCTVCETIKNGVAEYDYPVCFDFPVGHVAHNYPLLHGAQSRLEVTPDFVKLCFKTANIR